MIKVAFVGLGYWGPNLLRNLSVLEDVEITALCDFDLKRLESLRQRYCPEAKALTDYHALAEDSEVNAVVIATPIRNHYEIASFLLSAGKHVFIEKPMARTTAECQSLIDLAERHQRVLMVGHVFEFNA